MAKPSIRKINFSAAFMAGYNNPKIEVLTLVTDDSTTVAIDYPDYREISSLLRGGRVPLLLVTTTAREDGLLLQLNNYSTTDQIISFANTYMESSVAGLVIQVDFSLGKTPVIHKFFLDKT